VVTGDQGATGDHNFAFFLSRSHVVERNIKLRIYCLVTVLKTFILTVGEILGHHQLSSSFSKIRLFVRKSSMILDQIGFRIYRNKSGHFSGDLPVFKAKTKVQKSLLDGSSCYAVEFWYKLFP
jgi:hypothetical protein